MPQYPVETRAEGAAISLDREPAPATLVDEQLGATQSLTPEGFLLCSGVRIARTGPMIYTIGEVSDIEPEKGRAMITVERNADVLFEPDAILSFAGKPVTNDHPDDYVGPETWRQCSVGTVLNPRRGTGAESEYLIADLLISDAQAIADVQDGKREVSCGYDCEREQIKPGLARQIRIVGNHVALVAKGRCGPACAIQDKEPTAMAKKTRTVWDRMRTAFKANDEAAFEEELEKAQDEEGGDQQKIVIEVQSPTAPTNEPPATPATDDENGPLSKLAQAVAGISDKLSSMDERLKKIEGGETGDEAPGEQAAGSGDPDKDKPGTMMDSATLRDSFIDTLARAEILSPGIKLPTFDAKASQQVMKDALCGLRSRALKAAFEDEAKRPHVVAVLGSRPADFASMSCDTAEVVFRAASELVKTAHDAKHILSRGFVPQGPMTADKYQQMISERRTKRV